MTKQCNNKAISFTTDTESMMYDLKLYNALFKIQTASQTTVLSDITHANTTTVNQSLLGFLPMSLFTVEKNT